MSHQFTLLLSCKDKVGIVAAVAGFLAQRQGFILESAQYADLSTGQFFLRIMFDAGEGANLPQWQDAFRSEIAVPFDMEWSLCDAARKPNVLIMVSKAGHCFNNLLHHSMTGGLPANIVAVGSNHPDLKYMADWHALPYHHLPITADTKPQQEAQILELVDTYNVDVVVLARYMQVLSEDMCQALKGRAINIHHSFLPGFKGANPYQQAYDRGVKMIGATAHYVTSDLDEGPIIEQEVVRVDHHHQPADLKLMGQDIESQVLRRALKYHLEHRVILNGQKTVVFR